MPAADARRDRLYNLLPYVHRARDHEQGEPLRAVLHSIAAQLDLVEDDIARLYDNWFIETCEDWVVPYIGDLVGYDPLPAVPPVREADERAAARTRLLIARRDVANTIAFRRSKGTLWLLELLARAAAGWPARAVEFRNLLSIAAALDHPRVGRGAFDIRDRDAAAHGGGPFERRMHLPDVRHAEVGASHGRLNAAAVGLYVWRLRAYSVTRSRAQCLEEVGSHLYSFSALGNDTALFNRPRVECDPAEIAGPLDVPAAIERHAFEAQRADENDETPQASPDYYGLMADGQVAQSLAIWAPDWPHKGAAQPVPAELIVPANLEDWNQVPPRERLAVDPRTGRMAFPPRQPPKNGVWVSYHYGFSADVGGGEYARPISEAEGAQVIVVRGREDLQRALEPWRPVSGAANGSQPPHTVIEIGDSEVYTLPIDVMLGEGHSLQIRAAQRKRPVIQLLNWNTDRPDNLNVSGAAGSHFVLDGMLVAGRGLSIEGALASATVRHSTLVPGWSLTPECEPRRPAEPSIQLTNTHACLIVDHSIVGSIQVSVDEVRSDPLTVRIFDSIVDATGSDCDGSQCEALGAPGSALAHATLRVERSTLIGRVLTHRIELAADSIFTGRITVARRQFGCMRFCYVRPGSRTPRRFNCQPDLAASTAARQLEDAAAQDGTPVDPAKVASATEDARERVRPYFNSLRYGTPTYCQLAAACPEEIVRGAEDESEMGVFHDLYQPQRLATLQARLEEYTPAATHATVILVT